MKEYKEIRISLLSSRCLQSSGYDRPLHLCCEKVVIKHLLCMCEGVIYLCEAYEEVLQKKIPFVLRLEERLPCVLFCLQLWFLPRNDHLRSSVFSFLRMLALFAILDNAFSIISSSKTCLWLCLGHKIYYLISTHGKKRINEGSCVSRMNRVYISAKTSIVTP